MGPVFVGLGYDERLSKRLWEPSMRSQTQYHTRYHTRHHTRHHTQHHTLYSRCVYRVSLCVALSCALISTLSACHDPYPNRDVVGERFPSVRGVALDQRAWTLPKDWGGKPAIALLGYVQDTQFDIDRWLIGLDMTETRAPIYEVPTIKGLVPRMISGRINEGMRSGIPKQIWAAVITVYQDGERTQRFTGNMNPRNARVLLVDAQGVIQFFTDEGFSVSGLNALRAALNSLESAQ